MKATERFSIGEYITAKRHENGIWYLTIPTVSGSTKEMSTGIKGNRKALLQWVKEQRIREMAEAAVSTRSARAIADAMLVGRKLDWIPLMDEWKESLEINGRKPATIKRLVDNMGRFLEDSELWDTSPRDVTDRHVFDWVNGPSPLHYNSRKMLLQSPRNFFGFTQARGYTIHNPATRVEVVRNNMPHQQLESRVTNAFTSAQFALLEDAISHEIEETLSEIDENPYRGDRYFSRRDALVNNLSYLCFWHAAIHYSYAIGLRIGDIAKLEWGSMERKGWLIVHTSKSGARVAVPYSRGAIAERLAEVPKRHAGQKTMIESAINTVAPVLREAVHLTERYQSGDRHARYCFPEQAHHYEANRSKLSLYFRRLLNRHGFNGLSFHSLRHTRVRDWNDRGIDLETIALHVGHASTKTTEGYLG